MEKGGRLMSDPEEPEEERINGFLVLGREVRDDGMTVIRLEDGLVKHDDLERQEKVIERVQGQISGKRATMRDWEKNKGLPITAMRQSPRPKPSTEESK